MGQELARVELTDQQALFVQALLDGADETEALRIGGYSPTVLPQHVLRSKAVQKAISVGCDAKMRGPLKLKAMRAVERLLDEGPASTVFNAAKLVLEWDDDDPEGDGKAPTEMTIAELEALVRRKEELLKDVTPGNGAHH